MCGDLNADPRRSHTGEGVELAGVLFVAACSDLETPTPSPFRLEVVRAVELVKWKDLAGC